MAIEASDRILLKLHPALSHHFAARQQDVDLGELIQVSEVDPATSLVSYRYFISLPPDAAPNTYALHASTTAPPALVITEREKGTHVVDAPVSHRLSALPLDNEAYRTYVRGLRDSFDNVQYENETTPRVGH